MFNQHCFNSIPLVALPEICQGVYSWLMSSPEIVAIVSSRLYFGGLPQTVQLSNGTAMTYIIISRSYGRHLGGGDGTSIARIQISALSHSQQEADAVGQAVRDRLQGWTGTMAGVDVLNCLLDGERDVLSPPNAGTDQWVYQVTSDFQITHRLNT